ncbi:MAG: MtrB/PioB family decaheme-associated outer membrane protein, partial [Alphaproteobacteria bacterium]
MRSKLYASACTLVLAAALPAAAWAEDADDDGAFRHMEVEAGAGVVTEDSFKFGEYTGLEEDGVFAIGNVELYYRAPFDGGSGSYWSLTGYDLGLESRDIYAEFGQQGLFSVEAFYDGTPHHFFDDALTPYRGVGSDNLTLPGFWVADNNISGFTQLDAANQPLELSIQRDKFGATFNVALSDHWYLHAGARQEQKEGTDRIWGIFGTNGGNPASVVLPEPIDWQTTRIEGGFGYKSKRLQANVVYEASIFNNRNRALTWINAYSSSPGSPWDPDIGYPDQGRMSLHPDNQAHSVTFTGAYRFSKATRLSGQFRYIDSSQDETLLPYTVNPGDLSVPFALPRDSAEAQITNIRGDVKLVSRLSKRSTLRLSYTYDDRDNETPRDIFLRVPNDTADQGSVFTSLARLNHPFSFREHEADASVSYRVSNWLNLDGTYSWETVERTFQDVTDTTEHKGEIKANLRPGGYAGGRLQGWVGVSYASRSNDGRQTNRGHLTSHTALFLAGEAPDPVFGLKFENHPELQPFHTAGRDEIAVDASFTFLPSDDTSVTLYGKWADADFDDSEPLVQSTLGLREQDNLQLSVDGTWSPMERTQLFANYTYENFNRLVVNHEFRPFPPLDSPVQE